MNTLIETARTLVRLCSEECPDLAEVQRVCETTFAEIQKPPGAMRAVFVDTDEESGDFAKATFTALHWTTDRSGGCSVSVPDDQINIFALDTQKCELRCLIKALEALHSIQLRKDARYMIHLKDGYSNFRTRFSDAMSEEGCKCTGGHGH